jgi:propanol-preferring alcohol dehydrogenase
MRALRLVSPGKIAIQDVPVPEIEADEVLVQVAGAGLCHSDIHVLRSPYSRLTALTLGHETAGFVADVGRDVRQVAEQDPVLVYLVWACGRCRPCVQGRDNVCIGWTRPSSPRTEPSALWASAVAVSSTGPTWPRRASHGVSMSGGHTVGRARINAW